MSKLSRCFGLLLSGLLLVPDSVMAQAAFIIPSDSISDYSYYNRIETCNAMVNRVAMQLSRKVDSISYRAKIFIAEPIDTTSSVLRWNVQECMERFNISAISEHDSVRKGKKSILPDAMKLYYQGRHMDRFFALADSVMLEVTGKAVKFSSIESDIVNNSQRTADSETKGDTVGWWPVVSGFRIIADAIKAVKPVDFQLLDSLQDKYLIPILLDNKQDLKAYADYVNVLLSRIDRKYADSAEAGREEYEDLIVLINRDVGGKVDSDSSDAAIYIRTIKRDIYDKIYHLATLDSLRSRGPDGYFDALRVNHRLSGFKDERSFSYGIAEKFFTPLAFRVYNYKGDVWSADSATNEEYNLLQSGRPQIVMSAEALCRNESFHRFPQTWQRGKRTFECWSRYEMIKWIKENYPDIEITLITSTRGHFTNIAYKDPYEEAEVIKDAWWGFHKLPANILIYHTDFFNLGDFDRRRQDLPDENRERYISMKGVSPRVPYIFATLIAPDGRVVTTFDLDYGAVAAAKLKLDSFYSWYQSRAGSVID